MKNPNLLNELTIIIPTHERPIALSRQMDYLNDHNNNILNIFILDSSKKANKDYNKFENYFHIRGKNANTKISKILNKIKTKYVVTIGDDDFFIFEGLINCLKFLNNNNKYDGVHGKYVTHSKIINHNLFNFYKFVEINYPYNFKLKIKNNFANACDYISGKLPPLNYSVFRSEIFKKVWRISTNTKQENQIFLELIPNLLFYLYANIKCIDKYYISRQNSPRKKKQTQFENKNFKLLTKFIHLNLYKKKIITYEKFLKIVKILKIKKMNEDLRIKNKQLSNDHLKIFKMLKLMYLLIFKNAEFEKKSIKYFILKYPGVIHEIEKTISK